MAMTGSTPYSSMSNHIKERVTMIKVTVENFYSNFMAEEHLARGGLFRRNMQGMYMQ
uniref:Uncharacterized protein n=1 Tax=Sciurus vulgaris TaxID=55149 RepID=A0A8D2CMH0_SCIVU